MLDYFFLYIKARFPLIKKLFFFFLLVFIGFTLLFYFFSQDKAFLNSQDDRLADFQKESYQFIANAKKYKEIKPFVEGYEKISCFLTGDLCTDNPMDFYKNAPKSFFGQINNLINIPFLYPQSSFLAWTKMTLEDAGFIPKTYAAQGIGFASIQSISPLWKIFRDISYIILVLVIVVIGFLIMFRTKINAQTVISIENSLPKIVVAMILITFSFPIAGFLIDLTNIAVIIVISLLSKNPYVHINVGYYANMVFNGQMGSFFNNTVSKEGKIITTGWAILSFLPLPLSILIRIIITILISYLIGVKTKTFENLAEGNFFAGLWKFIIESFTKYFGYGISITFGIILFPLFLSFLILISGLFIYIKIIIMILKAYIENLLFIIISPFVLLFEAIPGKNTFSWWIKALLGNLIIYPIIVFVFILSNILLKVPSKAPIYLPLTSANTQAFAVLISFGITFLIPEIIKYVREALGIKPSPINIGLGTLFIGAGEGIAGVSKAAGGLTSFISMPIVGRGIASMLPPSLQKKIFPDTELSSKTIGGITAGITKPIIEALKVKEAQQKADQ